MALFYFAAGGHVQAAAPSPESLFNNAGRAFQDAQWERAEREFGDLVVRNPKFYRRSEAILYQAQARYNLKNFDGALELLTVNRDLTSRIADQYGFWIAEAQFAKKDFAKAAEAYSQTITLFPKSTNLLAAAHGEALSRFRLGEWKNVVSLLSRPEGAFRTAAKLHPKSETVTRGDLLLAEALLEDKQYSAAEKALAEVPLATPNPELNWRRQYLLGRIQRSDNRLEPALASATNLVALAVATKQPELQALSVGMEAEIFEQLKRYPEAVSTYQRNLTNAPARYQRDAMLKIIELNRAQNEVTNTMQLLQLFIAQNPRDPALDVAQLTLGELRLRQFYDAAGSAVTNEDVSALGVNTNLLEQAITNFNAVITDFEKGPQAPKAYLDRGWSRWHLGRPAESLPDFAQAAQRLPFSEEQAVARYKLAEVQFLQMDYTNAVANFQMVVTNYGQFPRVKSTLFDQALYKIVRGAVFIGDMATASEAVRRILDWFPESFFSDRSLLVYGQALNYRGGPADARAQFKTFLNRFPGAPLASELRLAVARTYIQEENWKSAASQYDDWIKLYPTNSNLPQAEYDRAWLTWKSGDDTNAFAMMTNLVARFPNDPNAPLAQRSIADFFFNQGQFIPAEANYQLLFQNTNAPLELTFQARLWAGRAACARLAYADARGYFLGMINSPQCPTNLLAEAYFRLGDAWIEDSAVDQAKPFDKFAEANLAFGKITQNFPTSRLAALAWGRMGSGNFLLATIPDPLGNRYETAAQYYTNALTHPEADFSVRGLAEIGLGTVFEKQGKTALALDHYLNVVYFDETKLRPGERPSLPLIKDAGLRAGRVLEDQQAWDRAIRLYERLLELLPNLKQDLTNRIERNRGKTKGQ